MPFRVMINGPIWGGIYAFSNTLPTLIALVHNGKQLCFSFSQLSKLGRISARVLNIRRDPVLCPLSQIALASNYPCERSLFQ